MREVRVRVQKREAELRAVRVTTCFHEGFALMSGSRERDREIERELDRDRDRERRRTL